MNKQAAINLVKDTFERPYSRDRFVTLAKNILHSFDEDTFIYRGKYIPEAYNQHIKTMERVGKYEDKDGNKIDILAVSLIRESTLGRARTLQRNFVSWYLNGSRGGVNKDAALVAFFVEDAGDWRMSLVKMDYRLDKSDSGKLKTITELTPAKRFSFLVGEQENSHTAQRQILPLLQREETKPTLTDLENAFSVEVVTKEFFEKYKQLFLTTKEALDKAVGRDAKIKDDFVAKHIDTVDFTKKLLGQIVFLYFLQKKGWFGVARDDIWGSGPKDFLRRLFEKQISPYANFFNDMLEPLFYEALASERTGDFYSRFNCKIPFLNGGLFDPLNNYDWVHTDIHLPNDLFSNTERTREGDTGSGILDVFDRYNFTVKEDEPLEKEVAVDPEMLGKVFENLLEVKDRKSKGTYYTPREIVHYMCQESLVNYLVTKRDGKVSEEDIRTLVHIGETVVEHDARVQQAGEETQRYSYKLPKSVRDHAKDIDDALASIKVCDPAVGSGAFLVGMMSEIIRLRNTLSTYLGNGSRNVYAFKHHAIQSSLYGVDIDPGAIEIAKLRLWLSLIVDEQDIKRIKPLPNLDYKIMQGNSLLEEYEGIKLFDEELLTKPAFDNSTQIAEVKEKISELSREFMRLYSTGELKGDKKQQLDSELNKYNNLQKKLTKTPKPKIESASLFDQTSEAKQKAKELKRLHTEFFDTAHKQDKDRIKKDIERITWELIEATLREQNKSSLLKQIEKFKQSNIKPFFLWKLNFSEVFSNGLGGFDVVIANPPYVRMEEFKEIKHALESSYKVYSGRADLFCYFYELGYRLLSEKGYLCFITSNKWLRANYGSKLKRFFLTNGEIISIIDFGSLPVFEAMSYPSIFLAQKTDHVGGDVRGCKIQSENELGDLERVIKKKSINLSQNELSPDDIWNIDTKEVAMVKKKIYGSAQNTVSLMEYVDGQIFRGIVTGLNEAFVIDEQTNKRFINSDSNNGGIIKPFLEGKDIKRYNLSPRNLYILFVSRGVDISKYPAIESHLNQYKPGLMNRATINTHEWYELQQPQMGCYTKFEEPKIVWGNLSQKPNFALDLHGFYLNAPANFISSSDLFLLGLLNSRICHFIVANRAAERSGGFVEYKVMYVEKMPIRIPTDDQKREIESRVNLVLDLKKNGENSDFIEAEINKMVYELYGLTNSEIEIVENYGNN